MEQSNSEGWNKAKLNDETKLEGRMKHSKSEGWNKARVKDGIL
jgi:hypothetical protein